MLHATSQLTTQLSNQLMMMHANLQQLKTLQALLQQMMKLQHRTTVQLGMLHTTVQPTTLLSNAPH